MKLNIDGKTGAMTLEMGKLERRPLYAALDLAKAVSKIQVKEINSAAVGAVAGLEALIAILPADEEEVSEGDAEATTAAPPVKTDVKPAAPKPAAPAAGAAKPTTPTKPAAAKAPTAAAPGKPAVQAGGSPAKAQAKAAAPVAPPAKPKPAPVKPPEPEVESPEAEAPAEEEVPSTFDTNEVPDYEGTEGGGETTEGEGELETFDTPEEEAAEYEDEPTDDESEGEGETEGEAAEEAAEPEAEAPPPPVEKPKVAGPPKKLDGETLAQYAERVKREKAAR